MNKTMKHNIINNKELENFILNNEFDILESIDLNNGKSLITYQSKDDNPSNESMPNVSIPIAAALTAYARIQMSGILADPSINVLYTDTDSAYIQGELDPKLIGKGLGQFKLEYTFKEAVFLAPKVYGGILLDGKELTKVKGFKNNLIYPDLLSLLDKNSKLELNQDKWFKSISEGNISIKNSLYTLIVTENKRQLIYDNNKLIGTKPFIIDRNKEIK